MEHLELILALLPMTGLLALDAAMFVSLGRQGDERRRAIVEKSSAQTMFVTVVYLLFCVVEGVVRSAVRGQPAERMSPLVTLTVIALIYSAHLLYYKRKYGG